MARNYYRAFFTLKEETPSYAAGERPSIGRCVVEARGKSGKITVYAQDLKSGILYKLYIIRSGEKQSYGAYMGQLDVGYRNKINCFFEFDPDDVGGHGFPIEEYDTVAVIVPKPGEIITPLVGYKNHFVKWKNNVIFEAKISKASKTITEEKPLEKPLEMEKTMTEEKPLEKPFEKPLEMEKTVEKESMDKELKITEQEITAEEQKTSDSEVTEKTGVEEAEENTYIPYKFSGANFSEKVSDNNREEEYSPQQVFEVMAKKISQELSELAAMTHEETENAAAQESDDKISKEEVLTNNAAYAENLLEENSYSAEYIFIQSNQIRPFESSDTLGSDWSRLSFKEIALLPINIIDYEHNMILAAAYFRYGYLLFGKTPPGSSKKYVLGIPGRYDDEDKRGMRRLGYNTFKSHKPNLNTGDYGYWLKEI